MLTLVSFLQTRSLYWNKENMTESFEPILDKRQFNYYLEFLKSLVDISDEIAMKFFNQQQTMQISLKEDGSFVTKADKEIEQRLRYEINQQFPNHGILGEEDGEDVKDKESYRWIIDPIDGTHGFMRGLPIWATLIALEYREDILFSMISAPALGARWWAGLGCGAYKSLSGNVFKIKVSDIDKLEDSQLLYTGVRECREKWIGFEEVLSKVWRERGVGDFWGHCLVAEGASEIMLDPIVNLWDVAALYLLVVESGGMMSDEHGRSTFRKGHAITTNKGIRDKIMPLIHPQRVQ